MVLKTLTRSDIAEKLCEEGNLTHQQAVKIMESVIKSLADGLETDGHVKISSFGTIQVLKKSQRIGRNPKTGQEVMIEPRQSISFKPSQALRKMVDTRKKK